MKTAASKGMDSAGDRIPRSAWRPATLQKCCAARREFGMAWTRIVSVALLSALAAALAGCSIVHDAAKLPVTAVKIVLPGGKKEQPVDLVEMEQTLMRFADQFVGGMVPAIDKLRTDGKPLTRQALLEWKIAVCNQTWSIATGPSAPANLLDMVTLVTTARLTVENHWLPSVYGESARPMLDVCQQAETIVWTLASKILNPDQQQELRDAIHAHYESMTDPRAMLYARAISFEAAKAQLTGNANSTSVFALLRIDPLAGLNPATRELAQTRLFAERSVFLAQRMTDILRWQTELWSLNTLDTPEIQQAIQNSTRLSDTADRLAKVIEILPDRFTAERQELIQALQSQEQGLADLAEKTGEALAAGALMASNVNAALLTMDRVFNLSAPPNPDPAPRDTNAEPFRITDYTRAASEFNGAASRLIELFQTFEQTLGSTNLTRLTDEVPPAVAQIDARGRGVVDYALGRALMLLAAAFLLALTYRWIASKWLPAKPSRAAGA